MPKIPWVMSCAFFVNPVSFIIPSIHVFNFPLFFCESMHKIGISKLLYTCRFLALFAVKSP
jgi:hypothetical protein